MVKKNFDSLLTSKELEDAQHIIQEAHAAQVTRIINVGTSLIESKNCITLAQTYPTVYAAIGIHPNDCTSSWRTDLHEIEQLIKNDKKNIILGIGECGLDRHYPGYHLQRQKDAFKAHIELALTYKKALVVHTRDARDETLYSLEEYKNDITRGIVHCFSEDYDFATTVISWGFSLGFGGTITYPKNNYLREILQKISIDDVVLETDAPFLPPQTIRGKQNSPQQIATIAAAIAQLKEESIETIAHATTANAQRIFEFD